MPNRHDGHKWKRKIQIDMGAIMQEGKTPLFGARLAKTPPVAKSDSGI
jgi:hypothetical protein